jgi:DNA-binding winged helix-turn-helix (wHTH) protein
MNQDSNSPGRAQKKRLRFGRYILDLDGGRLLLEGNEIALRPKTFAVLRYLVENSGRLVSKDELFGAVWPNLIVTDDALVQSVGELRRAIGADGMRFIKTIPQRGYRFEAAVSVIAPREGTDTPDAVAPQGARLSKPVTPTPACTLERRPRLDARNVLLGSLIIAGLLACGALLIGRTNWQLFSESNSINQHTKAIDIPNRNP